MFTNNKDFREATKDLGKPEPRDERSLGFVKGTKILILFF